MRFSFGFFDLSPRWVVVVAILILLSGIASAVYVVNQCGWQGLLYGQSAVIIAAMECGQ